MSQSPKTVGWPNFLAVEMFRQSDPNSIFYLVHVSFLAADQEIEGRSKDLKRRITFQLLYDQFGWRLEFIASSYNLEAKLAGPI